MGPEDEQRLADQQLALDVRVKPSPGIGALRAVVTHHKELVRQQWIRYSLGLAVWSVTVPVPRIGHRWVPSEVSQVVGISKNAQPRHLGFRSARADGDRRIIGGAAVRLCDR